MSLRSRLIIAFLLLSVLPLTAVTLLSYKSSADAVEAAAQREATDRAADVSGRMDAITADLGHKMDRMFVTSGSKDDNATIDPQKLRASLAPMLGDTAALVERVEFRPMAAAPPPHPAVPPAPGAPPPPPRAMVIDVKKAVEEA